MIAENPNVFYGFSKKYDVKIVCYPLKRLLPSQGADISAVVV